jgi:hypothetical protein
MITAEGRFALPVAAADFGPKAPPDPDAGK